MDARGVVLEDMLVLDGLEVRGVDLSGAVLKGGLSARGTRFRGLAWLRGTKVAGACDLSEAKFRTDFRADGLVADTVILDRCLVQGGLSLAGSHIAALSMRQALVMANMTLEAATIDGPIDMSGAEIMGGLWTAAAQVRRLEHREAEISGRVRLPG